MFQKLFNIIKPLEANLIALNASHLAAGLSAEQELKIRATLPNLRNQVGPQSDDVSKREPSSSLFDESLVRSKEAIANRVMALLVVAGKGEGLSQDFVDELVCRYSLTKVLSPIEEHFINAIDSPEGEYVQFVWRYEAAWVLLWALRYVEELDSPINLCDLEYAIRCLQSRSRDEFVWEAELRDQAALLDEADLYFGYHRIIEDARQNNRPIPGGLDVGVVAERYKALKWVVGCDRRDWDQIA